MLPKPPAGARLVTAGWGCTDAPPIFRVRATSLQASDQTVLRWIEAAIRSLRQTP